MLNFESIGIPVADIRHKDHKKKTTQIAMASPEEMGDVRHPFQKYDLKDSRGADFNFECAINTDTERQIIYVSGASGSGKSYWCRMYAEKYKKAFPKREIYLFSSIAEDSSIDKIKDLHRIKLSPSLLEDDISAEDFKDSLVILDDCDTIMDKKLRKKILDIQGSILQTGRHWNVSAIITSHVACNGVETRLVLNESHIIVAFPHGMTGRALSYLLEAYIGLDKSQVKKIKQLQGRAVCFIKAYPKVVVSDKEVFLLTDL